MFIDKLLQAFVTKETKFFPLFISLSDLICEAAEFLVKETEETDEEKRNEMSKRIKEHETSGDKITATLFDELYKAFVTPFDREDVHQFGSNLDTFLDLLDDSGKKISMYQPKGCDPQLTEIARYILEDARCTAKITANLEKIRDRVELIDGICDDMKAIEHKVDDLYEDYMAYIFKNEKDPIELIKKKNIVQVLEDTTDHAKHLSETVRSIIVKMS